MARSRGVEIHGKVARRAPLIYRCQVCLKVSYFDRKTARREMKRLRQIDPRPGAILTTYRCPSDTTRWHVGHDRLREQEVINETREKTAIPRHVPLDI